jgi:hypothetical protein
MVRREFSSMQILLNSAKYWIAGLAMLLVVRLENPHLPQSMSGTALLILSGGLVYFAVLFILRDSLCITYARKFRNGVRPH